MPRRRGMPIAGQALRRRAGARVEFDDSRSYRGADFQDRDRDRQREPPRTGAARVEEEHAAAALHFWPVGMAVKYRRVMTDSRIDLQFSQIVNDVYFAAPDLDRRMRGQSRRPRPLVVVAAH